MYDGIVQIWGADSVRKMVFEECGELINALAKAYRGRATDEDVISELADVQIMTEQMANMLGQDAFDKEKERKLGRLLERLRRDGYNH